VLFITGYAGVDGNDEVDKLAGQALIYGVLRLDILKCITDKFKEAENDNNNKNVYIQRMRELGVREGQGRQSVYKYMGVLNNNLL
jgi:hypothetical protein